MPAAAAQQAGITTVPSPMGGVDFYNSLFGMPPENAIRLTNWWPAVYGCVHRKGYRDWATHLPGMVGSLYTYHKMIGASYLYAFSGVGADNAMYDVTSADVENPPPERTALVAGLSTSIWQATMFANSGGTHKVFVSGGDNPIWVHGNPVVYERLTAGDGTVPGTISGFDPKNATDITIHQKRLWFVEKDSCYGWYLETDVVYGVAKKFDFGPLFKRGGFLQALATWTVDDGEGSDDLLVAFGSEGDVAVYKGINPNSLETWALQGVYYAGALLDGHRFYAKVSGDIKFLTTQGLCSLNDMLTSTRVISPQSNVESQPVQQFLAEQASLYGFLQGWDMKFVASQNMLIINIPSVLQGGSMQLVENVVNKRWTTFLGMDATNWVADYTDVPFYGTTDGRVIQAWTGTTDAATIANPSGVPITALVQQAYNYFGTPANNKQVGLFRPNFLTDQQVVWKAAVVYDFGFFTPMIQINPVVPGVPRWDVAIWDSNYWAGGLHAQKQWASAEGLGFAGSLCMATRSSGQVVWPNTDFTVTAGGIL